MLRYRRRMEEEEVIVEYDHFCDLDKLNFCQLDFLATEKEKIDHVKKMMKERGKEDVYTEEQIVALSGFEEPVYNEDELEIETQLKAIAYGSTSIIETMGTVFMMTEVFLVKFCCVHLIRFIWSPLMRITSFRKLYKRFKKVIMFWERFCALPSILIKKWQ